MYRLIPEQVNIWEDQSQNNLNVVSMRALSDFDNALLFFQYMRGNFMSAVNDGNRKSRKGIVVVVILAILVGVIASGYFYMSSAKNPMNKNSNKEISVNIEQGYGTGAIAKILKKKGVIANASGFKLLSRIEGNDGKYKAGTYLLSPSMSADEIMKILIEGKQDVVKITIPEGYYLKQIAAKVADSGVCSADEFMKETQEGDFDRDCVAAMQTGENRMEGFLFPATYYVSKGDSAHNIIDMMLKKFDSEYADALNSLKTAPKYNTAEIVTIASLIENEARLDEERALISSVIYNRLNIGMKLRIDATVQYALGEHKSRLYNSDLKVDSPYNTYKVEGLPAGPICSPGAASIKAAMEPASTEYLYYVASPSKDGSHNFATNEADFNKFAQEYWNSLK